MTGLLTLIVLLFSAVLHEVMHGYVAFRLGDPTARNQGRLTLNPLKHLDPLGSVLLPLLMLVSGSPYLFGWAKPVPVNDSYFARPREDMMKCALAGPLTNFSLAFLFSFISKIISAPLWVEDIFALIIWINIILGTFNLLPIPPLDGSRVFAFFLPPKTAWRYYQLEPYGPLIILVLVYTGLMAPILHFFIPLFRWIF